MKRLNLSEQFIRELLIPGDLLDPDQVALRWAGMPNKNERSLIFDLFTALTAAGYLAREDDQHLRVLRSAADDDWL